MACDERGSIYRFSKSKSWVYGGFVFNLKNKKRLSRKWNYVKRELCCSEKAELKWSHFFRLTDDNPLKAGRNTKEDLLWALDQIFKDNYVSSPISVRVPKDKVSQACFRITNKGNQVLEYENLLVSLYGQFALFLRIQKGLGEIWFDQLGSEKEQQRRQEDWIKLRDSNQYSDNKQIIQRISPNIKFYDSKDEPIIQIADFISGVIWAASEGEEEYLLLRFDDYFGKQWSRIALVNVK